MRQRSPPAACTDRRAVSPVIGVVMMVAITVILTGTVAAFVLGMGFDATTPPQASLALDQNDSGLLTITHLGGETVDLSEVYVRGDVSLDESLDDLVEEEMVRLRGGETVTIEIAEASDGDTITLVWDVGDDAAPLAEYRWLDE